MNEVKSIIERIERLESEKQNIADDIKEVFVEAKSRGYDTKALKEVIKQRKIDPSDLSEFEMLVETYKKQMEK